MARHRASSRAASALIALALAIATSIAALVAGAGPAAAGLLPPASPGKSVAPQNSVVKGKCSFTLNSVNNSTGTAVIKIAATAKPASASGYTTNAYTQMFCQLYDAAANLVAVWDPFVNGPYLPNTTSKPSVPLSSQYFICGTGFVKLNNGNQSFTPTVCA